MNSAPSDEIVWLGESGVGVDPAGQTVTTVADEIVDWNPEDTGDPLWWLSCTRFTVMVTTRDERIIETPPIVRKFVGQRLENLIDWMRQIGGLQMEGPY